MPWLTSDGMLEEAPTEEGKRLQLLLVMMRSHGICISTTSTHLLTASPRKPGLNGSKFCRYEEASSWRLIDLCGIMGMQGRA
jgi:hypothetical protein